MFRGGKRQQEVGSTRSEGVLVVPRGTHGEGKMQQEGCGKRRGTGGAQERCGRHVERGALGRGVQEARGQSHSSGSERCSGGR